MKRKRRQPKAVDPLCQGVEIKFTLNPAKLLEVGGALLKLLPMGIPGLIATPSNGGLRFDKKGQMRQVSKAPVWGVTRDEFKKAQKKSFKRQGNKRRA